jgi:hypothetical protein
VEGVTEYDAFGNPIEPGAPTATTTATAAPAPTPTPASPLTPPIPTIPTYGPSKATWGERVVGFLIFLAFAAPLGVGGYVAYTSLHTAKDAIEVPVIESRGVAPTGPATPAPAAETPTATPGAPTSMLHPTALAKALRAARRDPGGRLVLLRVAAERADLQLARRGGGLDLLQLRADGGRSLVRTPGTPGRAIAFAKVDAHAPNRLVHAAARRLGRSTKAIDYVVLIDPGVGGPRWSAYFKGGAAFLGDAHGRLVRRIQ